MNCEACHDPNCPTMIRASDTSTDQRIAARAVCAQNRIASALEELARTAGFALDLYRDREP